LHFVFSGDSLSLFECGYRQLRSINSALVCYKIEVGFLDFGRNFLLFGPNILVGDFSRQF